MSDTRVGASQNSRNHTARSQSDRTHRLASPEHSATIERHEYMPAGLENRFGGFSSDEGSNPSPSAESSQRRCVWACGTYLLDEPTPVGVGRILARWLLGA